MERNIAFQLSRQVPYWHNTQGFKGKVLCIHHNLLLRQILYLLEVPSKFFGFFLFCFISSSGLFAAAHHMSSIMFVNAEFYLLHSSLISEETQFLFLLTHLIQSVNAACILFSICLSHLYRLKPAEVQVMALWGGFPTVECLALQALGFHLVCLLFLVCTFTTCMLIVLKKTPLQNPHSLI